MKTIAILGRPNVGKSSLFNRLIQQRKAITSDMAGTTRDVKREVCDIDGITVTLSDTGGIEQKSDSLFSSVKEHALKEAQKVDLIFFMVDGKLAPLDEDKKFFRHLQSLNIPILLLINKIDNDKEKERAWEFSTFGTPDIYPISVSHNRGILALKQAVLKILTPQIPRSSKQESPQEMPIETSLEAQEIPELKIAIIGRVNVGKSSLLNALLGEQRSVVSDIAGTTIDPVDESCIYQENMLTFIDTAGLRRKGKIEGIEKYALMRTKEMLAHAHIALLVLDASTPLVELDEKIGSLVLEHNLGVIIVLNKWDIRHKETDEIKKEIRDRFKYLSFAPIITISAQHGRHIDMLKEKILSVFESFNRRIPTSALNESITEACMRHPIPSDKGKLVRVYYATQYKNAPPHISLVMNRPKALHFSYKRFLVNHLRRQFDFEGVPIVIETRKKGERISEDQE